MRGAAIEAARQICADAGEGGFTMDRVARLLGVRTPSLYHHFPGGRDEVIVALADHCSRLDGDEIARIIASEGEPLACFHLIARYFAVANFDHPYRQLTELWDRLAPPARDLIQERFIERVERPLIQVVAKGIADKQFRDIDAETFVRAFLALMMTMQVFQIAADKRDALPDIMVDLLIDGAIARV